MANNPNYAPVPPAEKEKKSNFWLVVIILVILIALLWPVLRRGKTGVTVTPGEGSATTSEEAVPVSDDTSLAPSTPAVSPADVQSGAMVSSSASPAAPTSLALKVFFGNQARNPKTWQCSTVYPVMRTVANTSAVARAALTELLRGPQPADSTAGFFTSLNPGIAIKQLTINSGVARVDFNQPLVSAGVRAQITETLKQFPTVRSVIISINGVLF